MFVFVFIRFFYYFRIYRFVYKIYYEWIVLIGVVVLYVYFLEYFCSNLFLIVFGLLLMGFYIVTVWMWFVLVIMIIVNTYSGYYLLFMLLLEVYDFYYFK